MSRAVLHGGESDRMMVDDDASMTDQPAVQTASSIQATSSNQRPRPSLLASTRPHRHAMMADPTMTQTTIQQPQTPPQPAPALPRLKLPPSQFILKEGREATIPDLVPGPYNEDMWKNIKRTSKAYSRPKFTLVTSPAEPADPEPERDLVAAVIGQALAAEPAAEEQQDGEEAEVKPVEGVQAVAQPDVADSAEKIEPMIPLSKIQRSFTFRKTIVSPTETYHTFYPDPLVRDDDEMSLNSQLPYPQLGYDEGQVKDFPDLQQPTTGYDRSASNLQASHHPHHHGYEQQQPIATEQEQVTYPSTNSQISQQTHHPVSNVEISGPSNFQGRAYNQELSDNVPPLKSSDSMSLQIFPHANFETNAQVHEQISNAQQRSDVSSNSKGASSNDMDIDTEELQLPQQVHVHGQAHKHNKHEEQPVPQFSSSVPTPSSSNYIDPITLHRRLTPLYLIASSQNESQPLTDKYLEQSILPSGPWTDDELYALINGVKHHEKNFTQISREFLPHRTTQECIDQYYKIKPDFDLEYTALLQKTRTEKEAEAKVLKRKAIQKAKRKNKKLLAEKIEKERKEKEEKMEKERKEKEEKMEKERKEKEEKREKEKQEKKVKKEKKGKATAKPTVNTNAATGASNTPHRYGTRQAMHQSPAPDSAVSDVGSTSTRTATAYGSAGTILTEEAGCSSKKRTRGDEDDEEGAPVG
ncbi:hypothetical protein HDU76_013731, partial [Blyttiomyces sp. JEL0837]